MTPKTALIIYVHTSSLYRKKIILAHSSEIKGFCLMKWPSENASKFAIILEYETPCNFFRLSFLANLFFL